MLYSALILQRLSTQDPGLKVHETSIVIHIYKAAQDVVREHAPARLESVKIAVGELSAVEPELLRFAWQALVQGSPDQATQLDIEWRATRQHCPNCGESKTRPTGVWFESCDQCGSFLLLEGGRELDILEVSITTKEETADVQETD